MRLRKNKLFIVLLLLLSLTFVGCTSSTKGDYGLDRVINAYITIDINPSIEIITNDEGLVVEVNGLNDDAIKLLIDTDFSNKTVNETIEEILELAIELGYLDFDVDNAILVSTVSDSDNESAELEDKISKKVKDFIEERKLRVEVLKASLVPNEDLKALAEELNVSVGKVKIAMQVVAIDWELTIEEAVKKPVRELNRIIQEYRKELKEFYTVEVRDEYLKEKAEILSEFMLQLRQLLNEKLQAASAEILSTILENSEATAEEVKALYQAFIDALLNVEIPEIDEEASQDEVIEQIKVQIEELKILLDELTEQLEELKNQIRNRKPHEFDPGELETILKQIQDIVIQRRDIIKEISDLTKQIASKAKDRIDRIGKDYRHQLGKLYKEVEKQYKELFAEIGVDLEALEEMLIELYVNEIKTLRDTMKSQIDAIHEQFKNDAKALKEQIKEENALIRDIWKNKR